MNFSELVAPDGLFSDGDWIEKKDQDENGTVRLIQLADIGVCLFKDKSAKFVTEDKAQELNCTLLQKGDILVARLPDPLGRACIFPLDGRYITAVDVAIVRITQQDISPKYIMYMINSPSFRTEIKKYESGTTRKRISRKNLDKISFDIPPFPVQQSIVSRIEELFSQLDASVAELKTAKERLKVYRQAVLKEAFDSALQDNPPMMPIEKLLTTERKGMATGPFGTMIKKHEHQVTGVPMLGIENIGNGKFIDGNKIFVTPEKAKELKSFTLLPGDIIISRSGTVGEICAVPKRMEGALLSTNLMRVSLNSNTIRSDYFIYLFQSKSVVLDQVKELCKGSTRVFLNQTILKQIMFPVPDMSKQKAIIGVIESRMSVCDNIEKTVDAALQQAEALRQSILKKAFEGEF